MILMAAPVKVILQTMVVSEAQVALNLKLRTNGNRKILRRGMKREKTDFLSSQFSQEVDQSQVPPRLK